MRQVASSWPRTRVTELLGLRYPIVQGPFGGGLSSVELAGTVSNAGGLGSFGAHNLQPDEIVAVARELRSFTRAPFALNLWVSTHDLPEEEMTQERFERAVKRLLPLYEELGASPPSYPERFSVTFEEQFEAILAARPPAFSFVFGIPGEAELAACREHGIVTIGTAITPEECVALDEAGVDAIVASGIEAGGHRAAFLGEAERSLVGTMALIPVAADRVRAPLIAAGGIGDARGVAAALALGAEGVQVGTAFLATDESGATPEHKALLLDPSAPGTRLTRAYTGRLARGIRNRLMDELDGPDAIVEPYPYQRFLLAPLSKAARDRGRTDVVSLWSGQASALLTHRRAEALFDSLVADAGRLLGPAPA